MLPSPRHIMEYDKDASGQADPAASHGIEVVELEDALALPDHAGSSRAGSSTEMRNGGFPSPVGYHCDLGRSPPFPQMSPRKFFMSDLSPKADPVLKPPFSGETLLGLSRRQDNTMDMYGARIRRQIKQTPIHPRSSSFGPVGQREKPPGVMIREFAPSPVASRRTQSLDRQNHTRVSSFASQVPDHGARGTGSAAGVGSGTLPRLFTKRRPLPDDPFSVPRKSGTRSPGKLVFKSLVKEEDDNNSRPSSIKAMPKPKHVRFQNVQANDSSRPSSIGTVESRERQGYGSANVTPVPSRQASAARFGSSQQTSSTPTNSRPPSTVATKAPVEGIAQETLEKMDVATLHLLARRTKGPAKFRYLSVLMHKHNETKDYLM